MNSNTPKKFQWSTVQAQKNDIRKNWTVAKAPAVVFAVLVFAALIVPFAGMLWAPTDSTTENRELAEAPQLFSEDGSFNVNVLADAGAYFEDHFAYKTNLVDADANVYASLFGESVTDQVVVGQDGWLYYAGTINDYQNRVEYSDRQANNIAHNLALLQEYCQQNGSQFVFTIAPNKSTVYPEHMSDQYPQRDNGNMRLLKDYLETYGVNYLDCFSLLDDLKASSDRPLYFLRDSHWNDKTAAAVADAIGRKAGVVSLDLSEDEFSSSEDYVGDLAKMLYPLSAEEETNYYAEGINDSSGADGAFRSGAKWEYIEGASTEDSTVVTESAAADTAEVSESNANSLLMYRDSFANNLIPFMATQYGTATFSKLIPYNALSVQENNPSVVVVERAQRHTDYLAQKAFIMPAPEVDSLPVEAEGPIEVSATCSQSVNGPLLYFEGQLAGSDALSDGATIYLQVAGADGASRTYEAFNISNDDTDWGYGAYLYEDEWAGQQVTVSVSVNNEGELSPVGEFSFDIE